MLYDEQDLSDTALLHSWCLYALAALDAKDYAALKSLLGPVNTRSQVMASVWSALSTRHRWYSM